MVTSSNKIVEKATIPYKEIQLITKGLRRTFLAGNLSITSVDEVGSLFFKDSSNKNNPRILLPILIAATTAQGRM